MMYLPLGGAIAIALAACTTAKIILEGISHYLRKVIAFLKPQQDLVSLEPLNSGTTMASCPTPTLPPPTTSDRLRVPTLLATIVFTSGLLVLSMKKLEDWRRWEIHWTTLVLTNLMPLTWQLLERKLLSPLLSCSHNNNNNNNNAG